MSSYKKKLEELVRVIHDHPRSRREEGVEEEVGRGEEELVWVAMHGEWGGQWTRERTREKMGKMNRL